jgi:hypothetical protein
MSQTATVFVYYRSAAHLRRQVTEAARTLVGGFATSQGTRGRLSVRLDEPGAELTWLETYDQLPRKDIQSFLDALDHATACSGLPALLTGTRHREVFVPADG